MTRIFFLHIPKTAGQTVHSELSRVIGPDATSPIRVHTQAPETKQFPEGFRLYSGHLDWTTLPPPNRDRYAFTILRDPFERIASFYLYLADKAARISPQHLEAPENTGLRMISQQTADDYFFGGDASWKRFIADHYDNFYCNYLATRKMRGAGALEGMDVHEKVALAKNGARRLDRIHDIENLKDLEADIARITGQTTHLANTRVNEGPAQSIPQRWPVLMDRIETDRNKQKLADFAALDLALIDDLKQSGAL